MKSTLRKFLGLSIVVSGLTFSAVARPGYPHGPGAEFRKQEREYVQAKVLPVLRQQRQKLEQMLNPTERTQLETYRTRLNALSQREMALRKAARATLLLTAPDSVAHRYSRPASSPDMLAAQAERREILLAVAQLANKYESNIAQLAAEMRPQQAQWAADLRALVLKSRPAARPEYAAQPQGAAPSTVHYRHGAGFHFGELRLINRPTAFLLLDPGTAEPATDLSLGTSLYPNPVAATSQLQYEVRSAGPVSVQLLDKNGNTLRTVVQATSQEKGNYTQPLDLSELSSGTYFYKVTTRTGTETKRFVKE
jgi:hypothetical protein